MAAAAGASQAAPPGANLMSMLNTVPAPAVAPQAGGAVRAQWGRAAARQRAADAGLRPDPAGAHRQAQLQPDQRQRPRLAPAAPPAPPPQKKPQTITDYAAAARDYRAPTAPKSASAAGSQSVSRKAESEGSSTTRRAAAAAAAAASEWECSRCTFLNHASLAECEMCGAERPGGKPAAPATLRARQRLRRRR